MSFRGDSSGKFARLREKVYILRRWNKGVLPACRQAGAPLRMTWLW